MAELSLVLEPETPADAEAILRLNERVMGPGRFARTAYRLRETTPPDLSLSFVARVGTLLVGANAMTPILIGETPALILGPLVVEPVFRSQGIGEALVKRSLDAAKATGAKLVIRSATSPITRAWASSAFRPAASSCPARSTRRASSIASSILAPSRACAAGRAGREGRRREWPLRSHGDGEFTLSSRTERQNHG